MASPRHSILQLLLVFSSFVLWLALLTFYPSALLLNGAPTLILATAPPLCSSLALVLILVGEWRSETLPSMRKTSPPTEWEVISLQRYKPSGLVRRERHRHVVVVSRRKIRRLNKPTFSHMKRSALGLPERSPGGLNRRRPSGWQRRLAW
ncbi:MAG: hypothetical protein EOP85_07740 [Verrucomicrobiaceae bacterium]|nr:MAG: hypothetical protein EOP85_07740 [Verrucomicrobiaceae bacterium]